MPAAAAGAPPPSGSDSKLVNFALGGLAGSIAEMITMPAVVVRTRLMVQGAASASQATKYTSFVHACREMLRTEGAGAFYKGATMNALFTPPARGMFILGMESSRAYVGEGTAVRDFAAGTAGQLISSLAYVPRDVIVERCAIDGQLSKQVGSSASSVKVLATIIRHEGLWGFYRAYLPHQIVWIPFNGLMMTFMGRGRDMGTAIGADTSSVGFGVLNTFISSSAAALLTTPIDVVKTRLQVRWVHASQYPCPARGIGAQLNMQMCASA